MLLTNYVSNIPN